MKVITIAFMLLCSLCSKAQNFNLTGLNSLPLCISTNKTASVVFPSAIRHVDIGTGDVLVQKVKDAGNILLLKAAKSNFQETNLSVVSADGKVYSFKVQYDSLPAQWIFNVHDRESYQSNARDLVFGREPLGHSALSFYLNGLLFSAKNTRISHDYSWGMSTGIDGIYVKDDLLFFRITCNNNSAIEYEVDDFKFYIRDAVKTKRSAIQERELNILTPSTIPGIIKYGSKTSFVVAIDKFTIPAGKYVAIQMMEKNGGRNLELRINNRQLIKAEVLKL